MSQVHGKDNASSASGISRGSKSQNPKVKSAISKAEQIQQREQLRQMVLSKFISDYAKKSKTLQKQIEEEVDRFFKTEKVTETTLKQLKQRIIDLSAGKQPSQVDAKSQVGTQKEANAVAAAPMDHKNPQQKSPSAQSQRSNKLPPLSRKGDDDLMSQASSKAPQSVYYLEGDEEDEWATLVKFDTELFKKEKELEKMREKEFKKKMKNELDRQLQEKNRKVQDEQKEESAFVRLQFDQIISYDEREKKKEEDRRKKTMNEKAQRDKQVHDENLRKKQDRKREQALDELLVQKIKEEKDLEEREQKLKREREKQRLALMMKENEEYRQKADQDNRVERDEDVRLQQEYIRLQIELEKARDSEKRNREEKIKKIMSAFADSVVKDQKAMIREEDEKMLKHILDQNEKDKQDDQKKKTVIKEQRKEMKLFLDKQMEEKKIRMKQEEEINKMQAEIWSKDRENFIDHETKKKDYIEMVNKKHQDILVEQMKEKERKLKKGKMNVAELLQNKSKFKVIAENVNDLPLKKTNQDEIVRQ